MDQDIFKELRAEAIDAAGDKLLSLNEVLNDIQRGEKSASSCFTIIKLDAHSIKSIAASFEMKALRVLCHRFEDFLFALNDLNDADILKVQFFVDRLSDCLDGWVDGREPEISSMMRELPAKGSFDENSVTVANIEVMLVMEPGTANKIITRELVECGYRMINVGSTMDAMQLIPAMRPDLVIVSRVMPELSGVDLVCAIHSMPTTRDIPIALIASVEQNTVLDLPKDVPLLHKGSRFADDVADVFTKLGLL